MTANFREGLYKAEFQTLTSQGWGLVVLKDGHVYGGDPMMYYVGNYHVYGEVIEAKVKSAPYQQSPEFESVFGLDKNTVDLEGRITDGYIELEGRSKQASGIAIKKH